MRGKRKSFHFPGLLLLIASVAYRLHALYYLPVSTD
jgi:hypothetical protein